MLRILGLRPVLVFTFVLALATTGFAFPPPDGKGGGNGGGGNGGGDGSGEEPPPEVELPPIEYVPTILPTFTDSILMTINDLNDQGMACGHYTNTAGERRAWFDDGVNMLDLNDLQPEGLDPDWIISSAVGLNNNGLVVGYASPFGDLTLRRGFILDLITNIIHEVPDEEVYGYARKVNDNGDVLLTLDGTPYLYNPGLRSGPAYSLEFISNDSALHANLSNSPPGAPAEVVGFVGDGISGMVWKYTQGVGYASWTVGDGSLLVDVNSFGDIATTTLINEEVQIRKNKTQTVTNTYLYREIYGVESYNVEVNSVVVEGFNDSGTVLLAGGGGRFVFADGWGLIDLNSLINPETALAINGGLEFNNNGPGGFGQIAGRTGDREAIFILTPVESP